ncbi:MAG: filamentous hemagglutinin N-terminal domain-containing protein, partial [Burkholderiales bacterium]|nr:filamentous hemagglutinin N-terminal domain-containing protein [Burkholderiales bacterium]
MKTKQCEISQSGQIDHNGQGASSDLLTTQPCAQQHRARWAGLLRPLPLMLLACFGLAIANPNGSQVVSGKADLVQQGTILTITKSANAIINWQNFSIDPNEVTKFVQPNAGSSVLNRVTGNYSSQILGALQSNGKVFLINPNGVLFGKGARVDVNGLVASSLNMTNADFLAGKNQFTQGATAGKVENRGNITTPSGGQVFLLAPNVENNGLINAPNGDVIANGDAELDASGASKGGTILLGGDYHGSNAAIPNAEQSFVGKQVTIKADATRAGDGGKVVVWSDNLTQAYGSLSANGAGPTGNGGFMEVSGKNKLDFHGKVAMAAGKDANGLKGTGKNGTLLLDPAVLTIVGGTNDSASDGTSDFKGASTSGTINYADAISTVYQSELEGIGSNIVLEAREQILTSGTFNNGKVALQNGVNLTMSTRNGGGDQIVTNGIDLTGRSHGANLEFAAQGTGSITITSGTANYNNANIVLGKLSTTGGAVTVTARGDVSANGAINSANGAVTLNGGNIHLGASAAIDSGDGQLKLNSVAPNGSVILAEGATLHANSPTFNDGIFIIGDNVSLPTSQSNSISLSGQGSVRFSPHDLNRSIMLTNTKTSEVFEITAP